MADIIIDGSDGLIFIDNTSISNVYDVVDVSLEIQPDDITNSNIIYTDSDVGIGFFATTISNTSTVYGPSSIEFTLFPNVISNTNIAYGPANTDILSRNILVDDIVNTNTIYQPTMNFRYHVDPIPNTATMFGGDDIIQDIFFNPEVITNVNKVYPCIIGFKDIPVVGVEIVRQTQNREITKNFLFSDFSFDFLPHPISGDIARLYDVNAINQSLENIILTKKFERPFDHYNVSSQIRSLLFALSDNLMSMELRSEIFQVIVNHEPRINVVDILVESTPERHELYVKIFYRIKTFDKINTFNTFITRT